MKIVRTQHPGYSFSSTHIKVPCIRINAHLCKLPWMEGETVEGSLKWSCLIPHNYNLLGFCDCCLAYHWLPLRLVFPFNCKISIIHGGAVAVEDDFLIAGARNEWTLHTYSTALSMSLALGLTELPFLRVFFLKSTFRLNSMHWQSSSPPGSPSSERRNHRTECGVDLKFSQNIYETMQRNDKR